MIIIDKMKNLLKTIPATAMAMVIIMVIIGIVFFGFAEVLAFFGIILAGLGLVGGIF